MAFVVCEAGRFGSAGALAEGECSIGRNGTMTIRAADLALVGIRTAATVLADPDGTMRLGLRDARPGERPVVVGVIVKKKKADSGTRRVNVRPGLKRLGLTASACAGRYKVHVHKDELLFVALTEARVAAGPKGKTGK